MGFAQAESRWLPALRAGGMDLSVIGIIGIILRIGIVNKNGIMLADSAIAAERDDGKKPREAIREACPLRFRPILMTTAAAMLAGRAARARHRPRIGAAPTARLRQVGGLALSQLLTL